MRGCRSMFLFGGLVLALGLPVLLAGCAVQPIDPEDELGEAQSALSDELDYPDPDPADDPPEPSSAGVAGQRRSEPCAVEGPFERPRAGRDGRRSESCPLATCR